MRSTFFGIVLGQRAISAQQLAMDTTGHNIANANTEGYSRQRVKFTTTSPYEIVSATSRTGIVQVGTGTAVSEIKRLRESFLDSQMRNETALLGEWEIRRDTLSEVEVIFNEPSESGIASVLNDFWASLQELSGEPESLAVRAAVVQRGQAVVEAFVHTSRQLEALKSNLDSSIVAKSSEINVIAAEISSLNSQIIRAKAGGTEPNDLFDKRDLLLDRLARIVPFRLRESQSGAVTVLVGGVALVTDYDYRTIRPDSGGSLVWNDINLPVDISSGELKGLLDLRNKVIPEITNKLDLMFLQFANAINEVHRQGYGLSDNPDADPSVDPPARDFFVGTGSLMTTVVNPEIVSDPGKIAASEDGSPGNGSKAVEMAQVRNQTLLGLGSSADDYYRALIGEIGIISREASRMADNQELLRLQIENQRQSVQGVSLDEEMVNLVRYLHAYSAAARYITAVDEMLKVVIQDMGLVGR